MSSLLPYMTPNQPQTYVCYSESMKYLHTMIRVSDIDQSLHFYCQLLGMTEVRRVENESGRFTLIFLAASDDVDRGKVEKAPLLELTYNWPNEDGTPAEVLPTSSRNWGHLAYEVDNIYETCQRLQDAGVIINRPPRDGHMAFIKSPDDISIELLQKGEALPPQAPWQSQENSGTW